MKQSWIVMAKQWDYVMAEKEILPTGGRINAAKVADAI